jgi:hypothetical protein
MNHYGAATAQAPMPKPRQRAPEHDWRAESQARRQQPVRDDGRMQPEEIPPSALPYPSDEVLMELGRVV